MRGRFEPCWGFDEPFLGIFTKDIVKKYLSKWILYDKSVCLDLHRERKQLSNIAQQNYDQPLCIHLTVLITKHIYVVFLKGFYIKNIYLFNIPLVSCPTEW